MDLPAPPTVGASYVAATLGVSPQPPSPTQSPDTLSNIPGAPTPGSSHHKRERKPSARGPLPPIETLDPDNLKDLSKEEIQEYLVLHSVAPGQNKPHMKRQLRALMQNMGLVHSPRVSQAPPTPAVTQQTLQLPPAPPPPLAQPSPMQYIVPEPPPPVPPSPVVVPVAASASGVVPAGAGQGTGQQGEEGAGKQAVPLKDRCVECPKKANKGCPYRRCRGCCTTAMARDPSQQCALHVKEHGDSKKAKFKAPELLAPLQDASGDQSGSGQQGTASSAATAAALSASHMEARRVALMASQAAKSAFCQSTAAHLPWATSSPALISPPTNHPNLLTSCPACGKTVGQLGSSLWIHVLEECPSGDSVPHLLSVVNSARIPAYNRHPEQALCSTNLEAASSRARDRHDQNLVVAQSLVFGGKRRLDDADDASEGYSDLVSRARKLAERSEVLLNRCPVLGVSQAMRDQSRVWYEHMSMLDLCRTVDDLDRVQQSLVSHGLLEVPPDQ